MRKLILTLALLALTSVAFADVYVSGYEKKDGTYVEPYYRSSPNSTTSDNYSTKGNVNPYTGQEGTKSPTYNFGDNLKQGSDNGGYKPVVYQEKS